MFKYLFHSIRNDGKAKFTCAQIECPDLFEDPSEGNCVWQNQLGKCCASKKVCGTKALAQLAQCHFEGTVYTEGQRMYPETQPCHSCVCSAGFENATRIAENPHCTKVDCGIEIRNLDRIRKGCVPVYFGESTCCPYEYRCRECSFFFRGNAVWCLLYIIIFVFTAEDSDEVMPSEGRSEIVAETDPKMQCTFAKLTLQRSELLNSPDKCVQCTCKTPPMVECRRNPKC